MASLRPLPPLPTAIAPAPDTSRFSTLEVNVDYCLERDGSSAPIVGQDPKDEKIIGYTNDKIISFDTGKIISYNDVGKQAVMVEPYDVQPDSLPLVQEQIILGLKWKTFRLLLIIATVFMLAVIVGGSVGGTLAKRNNQQDVASPLRSSTPSNKARYKNMGLSAIRWTDRNGTLHKRVYYQDSNDMIREATWDNSTAFDTPWTITAISNRVKPGTPIAAVAGYPHASFNYSLVKNVYYMSTNDELFERQAPANDSQAWEDDNFSGLYSGSNSTFLTAYWNQNIKNASQELIVLFQEEDFANGITQARYTNNKTSSNPWVANNFGFSQPKGSTFAMSLVSYRSGKHIMLYTVDDAKILRQHEYTISSTEFSPRPVVALTSEQSTGITVEPQSPLTVVAQDNQPLYHLDTLPECTHDTPLTNLVIFANADRSALTLNAWNCTSGFSDHTAEIEPLQKASTTYLSLASLSDRVSGDGDLYIMFDSGNGPQVEEWAVPKRAGEPWNISRNVTSKFES